MPWQRWFLKAALELHPTEVDATGQPLFRFRKVFLLMGRQNGKSTIMQTLTLWRMFVDRCNLVIGTAQDLEIAESLLRECYELAEEVDELKSELGPLMRGSGKMAFRLKTGETYKVKAASRRGGRGLSGELVLLDELREHQSWDAWGAVTKTTNAKDRAQIYGVSNAGDASSLVLRHFRMKAHERLGDPDGLNADPGVVALSEDEAEELGAEVDDSMGWFEWSAPVDCDPWDRAGWAQANPALGHRIRESTLASDAANDPEWIFRTEVLCQWSEGTLEGPFPPGAWDAGRFDPADPPQIVGNVMACVSTSQDRIKTYVAFAGRQESGRLQVEIVAERAGQDWVEGWLRERAGIIDAVTGQTRGAPVSALMAELKAGLAGVINVRDWVAGDVPGWTGKFYDLVRGNELEHNPWPSLDLAAATAVPRLTDGGAFMWDMKRSPTDIASLAAATGAVGLLTAPIEQPAKSAYESRGVLTV